MKSFLLAILLPSLILIGCTPAEVQTAAETDPQQSATASPATESEAKLAPDFPSSPQPIDESTVINAVSINHYILLTEPWKKYFRGPPQLLIVKSPSQGILDLLDQEQRLIKTVLDSSGTAAESSAYAELEERLDELKTIIPAAETASGYVPTSYNRSYTYIAGDTVYTRRHSYYNGYYYRTLREKQKSSSPELVRSVQSLIHNASLDLKDLDQRIDALQQMISQWNRRTSEMSVGGTSGIMREANQAYLETLRDFTKSFVELRTDVKKAEAEQARIVHGKSKMLQQWESFETNRLPILHDFLKDNAQTIIEATEDEIFPTPDLNADEKCVMVCTIGQRDLYFEVSTHRHKQHPFVLVDVTPQP